MSRPTFLAILSLPAAAIGYAVATAILTAVLPQKEGLANLLLLFVPLFVAGLCMIPFLAPFVDRKAKRDLEEYRAGSAAAAPKASESDTPRD